jgi:hypothetical protein
VSEHSNSLKDGLFTKLPVGNRSTIPYNPKKYQILELVVGVYKPFI